MDYIQDEEFVPEKGLNKNFRIPKRKADGSLVQNGAAAYQNYNPQAYQAYNGQMAAGQMAAGPMAAGPMPPAPQNVMANSYYNNYQYGAWGQQAGYYDQYGAGQVGASGYSAPITNAIYKSMNQIKEKPKTHQKNIFRETVPDANDASLPKELVSMFQPLYCKLCPSQLSSNVMAKMHYKSRNHEKKVKQFLIDYSKRTGEPLHKRAKATVAKKNDEDAADPKYFHCTVCDLPLTGKMHAESHYMGKNHQKALLGKKAPAGRGYYNAEGKWIRTTLTKTELKEGEDGFGMAFRQKEAEAKNVAAGNIQIGPQVIGPQAKPPATGGKYQCDLCNVGATCQAQLDMHYQGQKHLKKMRAMGIPVAKVPAAANGSMIVNTAPTNQKPKEKEDLSQYRTPSGSFYCQFCNLNVTQEQHFTTHLQSKNHLKKVNGQK